MIVIVQYSLIWQQDFVGFLLDRILLPVFGSFEMKNPKSWVQLLGFGSLAPAIIY